MLSLRRWFKTTLISLQIYYAKRRLAAIKIQTYTRRYIAQLLRDFLWKESKSIIIQCFYRKYESRQKLHQLKKERLADMIYKLWRVYRLHCYRVKLFREKKVRRIQRFYFYHKRKFYMKKYYLKLMKIYHIHQKQVKKWKMTIYHCLRLVFLKKKHAKARVMR